MTTPRATPDDGRPSAEARTRLAAELHEQLASSRLAWDAALLRSDAALAAGDQAEVRAALDDHRLLLGALQERLGEVVAAASVAREAEQVVRASAAGAHEAAADASETVPASADGAVPTGVAPPSQRLGRAASTLLGAAAAVLLVTGIIGGDLLPEANSTIAGSTVATEDVRARVASEDVTGAGPALDGLPSGITAELPTFSGSLPPTPRSGAGGDGATPDARSTTPPQAETDARPVDEGQVPEAPPVEDPASEPDADEAAGLRDLVERLRDLDGRGDVDTGSSLPRPLSDLAEALDDLPPAPPASDPTGGLR